MSQELVERFREYKEQLRWALYCRLATYIPGLRPTDFRLDVTPDVENMPDVALSGINWPTASWQLRLLLWPGQAVTYHGLAEANLSDSDSVDAALDSIVNGAAEHVRKSGFWQ